MKITKFVIHCSDTPNDRDISAADIHRWHLERGWSGIGYHKVIKRDGTIENGRPEFWSGAHAKGNNRNSLGVCLIGRDRFADVQLHNLCKLLTEWQQRYPAADIYGHYNLDSSKTCPNFDVKAWWQEHGFN